jgi:UDP-N-acetylmuramoyl-tripeptide--D-alanyl-D-alanine ligase
MPCPINLLQLQELIHASAYYLNNHNSSTALVLGIATDTRQLTCPTARETTGEVVQEIKGGEVFLALRGENFDGHEFASQAIAQGAISVITDHLLPLEIPQLVVANTLIAYQQIAQGWRQKFSIPVVGITGSFGKTTTKELVAALLSHHGRVLKTRLNYNNEIGVPKTLLELDASHDFAVIEMGMRGAGEIAHLTQLAQPTVGLITLAGSAHVGRLGSLEAIAAAKCELLETMPSTGMAILNHESQRLLDRSQVVWAGKTITYGLTGGDLVGELTGEDTLLVRGKALPLPLPGRHNAVNFLGAIAVAEALGLDWSFLTQGLEVKVPAGRAQRYQLPQDILLLDETYNAGLESMTAALHLLAGTAGQRRIAVLGTMKELGAQSLDFHYQVGKITKELNLDGVFVLVDDGEAEAIAEGADPLKAECFSNPGELTQRLQEFVQPGDTILFKASRSVKLDRVVDQFRQSWND